MEIIFTYLIIISIGIVLIPFLEVRKKGVITATTVFLSAGISGFIAIKALLGGTMEFNLPGSFVTGEIPVRIDALSGWFILVINFTIATGALYGLQYMKPYKEKTSSLSLHCIAYLLMQTSLTLICIVQNSIVFLFAWEIMALSSFILIIFEHYKQETIKAGINYLIQAHVGILFLSIAFIWVATLSPSFFPGINRYDFTTITAFSSRLSSHGSLALFFCFFIAFAIKAGFVPFHTWLPHAHPAAPSHVSGVMSGVIIKIGIYGILRMILLIKTDYTILGFSILFISVVSGVYGVILAIIQHNLKKLLAYHSIENIGIIGIGIGLGAIGMGTNNPLLVTLGFAGAMLHVLNHSLFKSLLFYGAGNVYQYRHTVNIDRLGGLIKRLPHTAVLFLVAALAICGLPPFNGFVSEFLIYSGLLDGLNHSTLVSVCSFVFSIFGLVLIGGLAILCFTKAFSAVFLGNPRHSHTPTASEENTGKLIPMYMIATLIISIGLFPHFFLQLVSEPVKLFAVDMSNPSAMPVPLESIMQYIGFCAAGFIVLAGFVFFIRYQITTKKSQALSSTWSCGYVGDTTKMQYTASSFIRTYRKLSEPLLSIQKKKKEITGIFPTEGWHETHPHDKVEEVFINIPIRQMKYFFGKFRFLQNGNPQFYIMYGIAFILLTIALPLLFEGVKSAIEFLNQL